MPSTTRRPHRALWRSLITIVATVLVAAGPLASPARAVPAAPADLAATDVPVLSWSKVPGAAKYEVQVDGDGTYTTIQFSSKTTNTRAVPTKAMAGHHYWRVRSFDAGGTASDWTDSEFDLGTISAPSALSPDGDELAQPTEPPLLSWQGVQGAEQYKVEVDADSDFVGATSYTTQTTSLAIPVPLEAGDYWWRVTADLGDGVVSLPSNSASFIIKPLASVVLTSPADSPDTEVEDVVLDWDPVPGAATYELRVARDADFQNIVETVINIRGTRYSPAEGYNNTQYYWQVRAIDLAGKPTEWTTVQNSFSRVWPDRPQPVYPTGGIGSPGSISGEPYIQWTPVQHAAYYWLEVGSDQNFSPDTYNTCRVMGTTYTPGNMNYSGSVRSDEKCRIVDGQVTYWRVRPMDTPFSSSGIQGLYSPTQAFVWHGNPVPGRAPANGATVDIPTLSWSPVSGVEKYKVELVDATLDTPLDTFTTYSTSLTPFGIEALDPAHVYVWNIQAYYPDDEKSVIYSRSFRVSGTIPTTGAAPLTPLSGRSTDPATLKAPDLSWEPQPGATHYKILFGNAGSGIWWVGTSADVIGKSLPYPRVTDTGTRSFAPGDYDWFVQAYDDNGLLATGPISTFHISGFPAVTGQSIALDGMTLDNADGCSAHLNPDGVSGPQCAGAPATPVLSWDEIPGMSNYIVYVSNDSSFTNLLEGSNWPATQITRFVPTLANTEPTYPESQAGKSYFWHIRPCKTPTLCAADPVSSTGMATNAFRKQSPGIELVSPEADSSAAAPNIDTSEITFEWTDYFDTSQATTWPDTSEIGPQAAKQYHLQVDDSPNFTTPLVDDVRVDQATYTAWTKLYPEGQLYWRVQAIDGDGKGLPWSETRALYKSSPPVTLTAPVNDEEVSGTAAFRWEPQPYNGKYHIEVFRNNDTSFSTANRVFMDDTKVTAYTWSNVLPASDQAYVWRVRRYDSSNNLGQWSQTGRFHSTGASPTLLEPAADSLEDANGPLFTWTPVPGAASYSIEVRSTSRQVAKVTTARPAWATVSTMPDGKLTWQVTALDANSKTLGISEARPFRVDTLGPKVVSYSPRTKPKKLSVNVMAYFSEPVKNVSGSSFQLFAKGKKKKVAAVVTLDATGTKAKLNPVANLKRGLTYTVKVKPTIVDAVGNPVTAFSWTFKT